MRMRLIKEAIIASELSHILSANNIKIAEVHLDLASKQTSASYSCSAEASNIVKAYGFKVKLKPYAWASGVADWHTKR